MSFAATIRDQQERRGLLGNYWKMNNAIRGYSKVIDFTSSGYNQFVVGREIFLPKDDVIFRNHVVGITVQTAEQAAGIVIANGQVKNCPIYDDLAGLIFYMVDVNQNVIQKAPLTSLAIIGNGSKMYQTDIRCLDTSNSFIVPKANPGSLDSTYALRLTFYFG